MTWRTTCWHCGHTRKRAYWSDAERANVLARCTGCGANFHGVDVWLSKDGAARTARGVDMETDPHVECGHGHRPCEDGA